MSEPMELHPCACGAACARPAEPGRHVCAWCLVHGCGAGQDRTEGTNSDADTMVSDEKTGAE